MDIVSRAKNIITTPNTEWPVIAGEAANTGALYSGYVAPLAAIGPIALIIGQVIAGGSIATAIVQAIVAFVLSLIAVFIDGLIFSKLAPAFGGKDDMGQGLKLAAYSNTPGWIIAIINIVVPLVPIIGILGLLALYGLYLIYAGVVPVMGVPREKAVGYTVVAIIVAIVVYIVLALVIGGIIGGLLLGIFAAHH
jgi:hypothetical protein